MNCGETHTVLVSTCVYRSRSTVTFPLKIRETKLLLDVQHDNLSGRNDITSANSHLRYGQLLLQALKERRKTLSVIAQPNIFCYF